MKQFQIIIFFLFIRFAASAQDSLSVAEPGINYWKLGTVTALTAGGFVYGHALNNDLWWKGEKSSFHFNWQDDWTYALGSDKFGHFYFPYVTATVYSGLFRWSGLDNTTSLYAGASVAFAYQSYIEIRDGFSKQWGFSWGDFAANTLGAAYPLLQHHYPLLDNLRFKMSFYPSERYRNNSHAVIFDDYESTYDWVSIKPALVLPESAKKYMPSFINFAIGHSVKKLDISRLAHHEWYIAIDWNVEALPGDSEFLLTLKRLINFYKLPAPAVKIYPGVVWYGLKF